MRATLILLSLASTGIVLVSEVHAESPVPPSDTWPPPNQAPFAVGNPRPTDNPSHSFTPANEHGQYRHLITFAEPGLIRQVARAPGESFDLDARETRAVREMLIAQQAARLKAINNTLGRSPEVTHRYLATHSGMAAWLTIDEAEAISRLPGVATVEREREYALSTTNGPWFIGADTLWDGTNTPDNNVLRGEGMVLGHLDSGIDPAHPSFANDPACGFGSGGVPDKVLSSLDCGSTDETGLCNGPNPVDVVNHGSHTASTAVGNFLDETAVPAPIADISGVAPCAHIRAYNACPGQTCPGAAIVAGINSILLHGDVDVMNFSISGGTDPWNDGDRLKLDLVETGVLVTAAAGNTSGAVPVPTGQVNHRGPWVLSVAASSHDGTGSGGLLSASGPGTPPDETRQIAATQGSESPGVAEVVNFPIRHFDGQNPGAEGCDSEPAFPDNFFENAAALIQRGECPFTEKIANAFEAGAELVIVSNNEPGALHMDTTGQPVVPAYAIPQTPGNALQAFVSDHPDAAVIDFETVAGDVLGAFSLRGPTPSPMQNLTKPDIAAPGISIYAAVPEGYDILNGSSMASPHAAGGALLLRQAHPDWTVPEVMSALMTTAETAGRRENLRDAWNPDDIGSGRVDLTKAARVGWVMDETIQNYLDADPAEGGDVRTLNTASLRNMDCIGSCTWTRNVRNTLDVPSEWTVAGISPPSSEGGALFNITIEPETFEFAGELDETQELTITVTPLEKLTGATVFGEVVFAEAGGQAPDQHLTVAVLGRPDQPIIALDPNHIESTLEEGESESRTLTISNPGEEPLEWTFTEDFSSIVAEAAPTGAEIDCNEHPGLIIQDTGTIDRAYAASPSSSDQVLFVDRFTPNIVPADFTDVCVAFVNLAGPSAQAEFEIVVFDDDGQDSAPGTELGALSVTAEGFPSSPGAPVWRSFDISTLEIAVSSSSVYIGARWPLTTPPTLYLGADESAVNPPGYAGGWQWISPQNTWRPTEEVQEPYRAMFIRPAAELGSLDCTLPDWVSVDTANGMVAPDDSHVVGITLDVAGLEIGTYTASLCLQTNDPDRPLAVVPLTLIRPGPIEDPIFRDRFE